MSELKGLMVVLFCAIFAGYWLLLAEQLFYPHEDVSSRVAPKLKHRKPRAKKGAK